MYTQKERAGLLEIGEYLKRDCEVQKVDMLREYKMLPIKASMSTIYISGGKKNNIRPGDILGALTKDAGLEGTDIGKINVLAP